MFTEVCQAIFNGITTTNKNALDQLYSKFDKDFPEAGQIEKRLDNAVARLVSLEDLHRSPLMRPYIVYSLVLALLHMEQPVPTLVDVYQRTEPYRFERDLVTTNLSRLAEALEDPEETLEESSGASESESKIEAFVLACSGRTNVKAQREIRFRTLCEALEPKLL